MRNRIKINYNLAEKTASFQFMSDNGYWTDVHKASALSRKKYASAIAEDRINELLDVIDTTYNVDGCGVIISFSGDETVYKKVSSYVQKYNGIEIERKESKGIVSGKRNSGKTCLIEGIFDSLGKKLNLDDCEDYIRYFNEEDGITLYEIKGIDLGIDNVNKAYDSLVKCIDGGSVITVFYCLLAKTGKIEDTEIEFINRIENEYPRVKVTPVITGCIDERKANEFANRIVKELGMREVLITLAKDMNTKVGPIPSFGIDKVIKNLSGDNS